MRSKKMIEEEGGVDTGMGGERKERGGKDNRNSDLNFMNFLCSNVLPVLPDPVARLPT